MAARKSFRTPTYYLLLFILALAIVAGSWLRQTAQSRSPEPKKAEVAQEFPQMAHRCRAPKPTIVLFTAEWCGYCTALKEKTLANPKVKKRLEGYDIQYVDLDANRDEAQKAGVQGVPALFLIAPSCRTVGAVEGYLPPPPFLKWLTDTEKKM